MKPRRLFRTVLYFCFVLLFGVAGAHEIKQDASPKRDPIYIPPNSLGSKVKSEDTLGAYSFREFITPPGTGPVPHRHSREDESFYILDGQLEFKIGERGERLIVAAPGSFVFAPRGIPHTFKNVGSTPARALVIISPAGLENFFEERNALQKELLTTDPSYPGRDKALSEKYGLEYSSGWSFSPKASD
jgi:quercetin dioxygenase-like cupin family protein